MSEVNTLREQVYQLHAKSQSLDFLTNLRQTRIKSEFFNAMCCFAKGDETQFNEIAEVYADPATRRLIQHARKCYLQEVKAYQLFCSIRAAMSTLKPSAGWIDRKLELGLRNSEEEEARDSYSLKPALEANLLSVRTKNMRLRPCGGGSAR